MTERSGIQHRYTQKAIELLNEGELLSPTAGHYDFGGEKLILQYYRLKDGRVVRDRVELTVTSGNDCYIFLSLVEEKNLTPVLGTPWGIYKAA